MSTLAERLAQRAADFAATPATPKPETPDPGPRMHYLRRDGTTICGQPARPSRLHANTPECRSCTRRIRPP